MPNTAPPRQPAALEPQILQFGTGRFLRGLVGDLVHHTNEKMGTSIGIVVVKSTGAVEESFRHQHFQYTVFIKGYEGRRLVQEQYRNQTIVNVLQAATDWDQLVSVFCKTSISLVVSNVTEAGLQYEESHFADGLPPSFPARLCLLLYYRYLQAPDAPLAIAPLELVIDNGLLLKNFVRQHAQANALPAGFVHWLNGHVVFYNSIIDRIVTLPSAQTLQALPYADALAVQTEPFALWALAYHKPHFLLEQLAAPGKGLKLEADIAFYTERKLKLLNAVHSLMAAKAMYAGCISVQQMMQRHELKRFIVLLMDEILMTFPANRQAAAKAFAQEVLQRFQNPFNTHYLADIVQQYTGKMQERVLPLLAFYAHKEFVPVAIVQGFAWYLFLMQQLEAENGAFRFKTATGPVVLRDAQAHLFAQSKGSNEGWQDFLGNGLWKAPGLLDLLRKTMSEIEQQVHA